MPELTPSEAPRFIVAVCRPTAPDPGAADVWSACGVPARSRPPTPRRPRSGGPTPPPFGDDPLVRLRVGFVTGATPDKWARTWRTAYPDHPLDLVPVSEEDQGRVLLEREVDMCLVRLPLPPAAEAHGVHTVRLYEEGQVVVASVEHLVAAADEVVLDDLADEQLVRPHASGWTPRAPQLDWPVMTEREAVETVAAGTGVVLLPASVARLLQHKDVVARPVTDLAPTEVALVWPRDVDGPRTQAFVGITRGRTPRSSR